ncbi:AMP-dependent synthetase/ligase [Pseudobacteriovorax antillogorgiicola]|uniref:Long-chain acyl-CoA synthetase n=1 Tax=Pseudobacteriovorax antillogorgiicola TaxID=1513793 RepID=A0A1Y6CNY5_9BACT|nr:long-chain fatty acid--CoA ligase [Pseudobacteriovorax antillogorgiicola]TCS44625.1 long-chain acyl-CoA synthetase [Pseudobacteriovorax antillogorgiicola]SMF78409.1 long-chain acyl-CoA synthetase [Pseudobacteriovorax antillogorgiicola]
MVATASQNIPNEVEIEYQNLVEMQERSCVRWGKKTMFGTKRDGEWVWINFDDFAELVKHVRGGLQALNIEPGDKVGIISRNCVEWAVVCYASLGLGAAIVPMYESQSSADWEYIINHSGVKVVFTQNSVIFDVIEKAKSKLPHVKGLVNMTGSVQDKRSFIHLLESGKSSPVESYAGALEDLALVIYTSGTTDKPKGVMLSHRNVLSQALALENDYSFSPEERTLSFLPWAHVFGQGGELHALIQLGYSTAFAEGVPQIVQNLSEVKPTMLMSVPRIFNRIYDSIQGKITHSPWPIRYIYHRGMDAAAKIKNNESLDMAEKVLYKLADILIFSKVRAKFGGHLKYAVSGGAALDPEVAHFMDRLGITVYEGYGLTETSPMISTNSPSHMKIGTVGKPVYGVQVKLDSSQLGETKNSHDGEIVCYGPNVMQGYLGDEEATKKAFTEDGGLRTGDVGHFDDEGFLVITGRIKEQYKLQNGKWVVPSPIEDKLALSPYVGAAMVYGNQREYNIAILSVNLDEVVTYAVKRGIQFRNSDKPEPSEIQMTLSHPTIQDLFETVLNKQTESCREYEKPRKFVLSSEEWSPGTGLTTQTFKLKRMAIAARYADQIDRLFSEDDVFAYSNHAIFKGQGAGT